MIMAIFVLTIQFSFYNPDPDPLIQLNELGITFFLCETSASQQLL